MNLLTMAAIALVTSFTLGAIARAVRDRREFGRFWSYRIAVAWLVILFGLELLMLAFDYWAPLSDRHVWIPLSLPGAALLAVFAVLIAHAFTAHS